MQMTLDKIERLMNPPGEPLPPEKAAELVAHYIDVAKRHKLDITPPLKFIIDHATKLYARAPKTGAAYSDDRRGVSMFGRCGTGKTIASAFLIYMYETLDMRCQMLLAPDVAKRFAVGGDSLFWDFVRQYDSEPLVLDDLGSERITKNFGNDNPMAEWIMHRYNNWQRGGPETHITGNLDKEQFIVMYGDRVYDRVREFTLPTQFVGTSLRSRQPNGD